MDNIQNVINPTYSGDPNGTPPVGALTAAAPTLTNPVTPPITQPLASGDPGSIGYNPNPLATATNPLATTTNPLATATNPLATATNPVNVTANPNLTQAGTSILGPAATVVRNTMYTSDGRIITNPIVSDYEQYGLVAPKGTPTVSAPPPKYTGFGLVGSYDPSRRESEYTGASMQPVTNSGISLFGNIAPKNPNPYATFGTGQDVNKAYLTQSGAIVLPTGQIIQNPTAADYAQYQLGISSPFDKKSVSKDESNVINTLKVAKSSALDLINEQIKAQGLSKQDANQLRQSVSSEWDSRISNYSRTANLPGSQGYNSFFTLTPEQYIAKIPEDKRSFRPSAEQVFNALPEAEKAQTSLENVRTWLNNNPDYKITLTPELVKSAADAGNINLGTKLTGWDYDKLGVTDPEQLKALNAAGNRYSLGLNMLNDWGLLQGSKQGKTKTGFGIRQAAALSEAIADGVVTADELHQYLPKASGRARKQFAEFANDMMALRGDTDITLDDLRRITKGGTDPKLVDPDNNLYAVSSVKYKKGDHYILVQKTGDDQYRVVGGTRQFTPTGGGGFWNWAPKIAGIALAFAAPGLGSAIGSAITGATTAGLTEAVIGNAILGALQSGITGGNIGLGALTGGIGGGIGNLTSSALNGVNIGGLPLNSGIVNGISGIASGLATSPITGANPGNILTGGLINLGGNVLNSGINSQIGSLMPNASPGLTNAISSGLTAGALSGITGADPRVIAAGTLANLANSAIRGNTQPTTTNPSSSGLIGGLRSLAQGPQALLSRALP